MDWADRLARKTDSLDAARAGRFSSNPRTGIRMVRVSEWILQEPELVDSFVTWRRQSRDNFFARFAESRSSMEGYLSEVCADPFRVLFLIEDQGFLPLGHIGLKALDTSSPEIDAVMVNPKARARGVMTWALEQCILAVSEFPHVTSVGLEVLSTNQQAISLYSKCGFKCSSSRHLRLIEDEGFEVLVPCGMEESDTDTRGITMTLEIKHDLTKLGD